VKTSRFQRRFVAVLVLALLVSLSCCKGGTAPATPPVVVVTATPEAGAASARGKPTGAGGTAAAMAALWVLSATVTF